MSPDDLKRLAAEAALAYVPPGEPIGVGTGSTANHFIELLKSRLGGRIAGAVPSSEATRRRLEQAGIRVLSLADADELALYVDGADEFDPRLNLLKGGGGALTREKIVASAARRFVCIVDESKRVDVLGAFPLPIEVVAFAEPLVARLVRAIGGEPRRRAGFLTDNGNPVLDVEGLRINEPEPMEMQLDAFPGVVTCGIFARRPADVVLMGTAAGVQVFQRRDPGLPS